LKVEPIRWTGKRLELLDQRLLPGRKKYIACKTAEQVAKFGGTAGVAYDPNYHTERDDITNVNRTSIDIMSDAVAHAALTLAQDPTLVP